MSPDISSTQLNPLPQPSASWCCGRWLVLAAMLVLWIAGCTRHRDFDVFVKDPMPAVSAVEYRMAPPDVIYIYSKRVREISGHTEAIRADGRITLPLLGSVMIAGKTPEEASAELAQQATEFYEDADITLRVVGYESKRIFVWGHVRAPGPYPYNGRNTVYRTLSLAQPTHLADFGRVEILRPSRDGQLVKRMTINIDKMIEDGNLEHDALLQENDVIHVPANPLAAVGLALQQLLLPLQPAAQTVNAPADIARSATGTRPYGNAGAD